jgi:hypothetical protein
MKRSVGAGPDYRLAERGEERAGSIGWAALRPASSPGPRGRGPGPSRHTGESAGHHHATAGDVPCASAALRCARLGEPGALTRPDGARSRAAHRHTGPTVTGPGPETAHCPTSRRGPPHPRRPGAGNRPVRPGCCRPGPGRASQGGDRRPDTARPAGPGADTHVPGSPHRGRPMAPGRGASPGCVPLLDAHPSRKRPAPGLPLAGRASICASRWSRPCAWRTACPATARRHGSGNAAPVPRPAVGPAR